ncbi:3-isopropylmalate dehydratase [Mycolicibacterium smegmatis]|uniref:LeuD/DmdB family oxidoreductase small subunit n=1 Tax=Mycolicibacterium smegmatis TaxID=1772 RepID=UPI0013036905|nr:3-isopropylmalate dehydratase [Mycolicibacterium smegmatis]
MSASTAADPLRVRGRAWVFGDGVNTDDMYPGFAMKLPLHEATRHMFDATRPGWSAQVKPGDIVVAGRNFGLGSSRPVAELFVTLGVSCLIAEQFNSLFLRNALNYGLPAVTLPDARMLISEGHEVDVDVAGGTGRNLTTGASLEFQVMPDFILDVVRSGGLTQQLVAAGYLDPEAV